MDTENENKFCAATGAKTPSVSVKRVLPAHAFMCERCNALLDVYIAEYICMHMLAMQMDDTPMWSLKKLKAYIIHVKSRYVFVGRVIAFK